MANTVIVGAGECGTRAALALRNEGYEGTIVLIGDETGLPYERPPLSKPDGETIVRKTICDEELLASASIEYLHGETASSIDTGSRQVSLSSGQTLAYDQLLLATGAAPRTHACEGSELALVFRTIGDAETVYRGLKRGVRVAIIGAGLIGMELAASFTARGATVTVIETGDRAMARAVPEPFARRLEARHRQAGVEFKFGSGVTRVTPQSVELADGTVVPADITICAIGVIPNTELAKSAGIEVGNGILVDEYLRTNVPEVYAAGDCACIKFERGRQTRHETWRNAQAQAAAAARNLAGANTKFSDLPWFWSDQFELGLQVVGIPSLQHASVTRSISNDAELIFYLDQSGTLIAAAGIGPGTAVSKDIRLAEMLIEAGAAPDPEALAGSATLKSMLRKTVGG